MTTSDTPDYGTLTGAEFLRAVGDDPRKWAAAMFQAMGRFDHTDQGASDELRIDFLEAWLRDAMDAARKAQPAPIAPATE